MKRSVFLGTAASVMLWPHAAAAAALNTRVHAIARSMPGTIGVYARTLAAGPPLIAYRATRRFPTASIIKVLIMTTAYFTEELHPGTLSEKLVFDSSDLIGGSDFMSGVDNGEHLTVKQLIVPMIQVSDNTAANMLIGHFGVKRINAVAALAGMTRTRLARKFLDYASIAQRHDNVSTPADMARLLYLIERGAREDLATIVSPQHCRAMIRIMLGQTDRDGIPAGLPPRTSVANKTGEIDGTRNDIAIVEPFGDSPFILAIMTENLSDYDAAYDAIHAVARITYHAAAATFA